MGTPSVFLASTFDKVHPLYKVYTEAGDIFKTINAIENWKCHPHPCTILDDITTSFSNLKTFRYEVFHFAGHARDGQLQLNQRLSLEEMEAAKNFWADVGSLAKTIKLLHPVRLVFLNGCSTYQHVEAFQKAGIPAVIYSTMPLKDNLGAEFAKYFYQSFFQDGNKLQDAFNLAKSHVDTLRKGDGAYRGLDLRTMQWSCRGMGFDDFYNYEPYELYTADPSFEHKRLTEWSSTIDYTGYSMTVGRQNPSPRDIQSKEIPETNVLLCDRRGEVNSFYQSANQLNTNKEIGPFFLFIHEKSHACPDSLIKRLEIYGEQEFIERYSAAREGLFNWKKLRLPQRLTFQSGEDYKTRLIEIYREELFECNLSEETNEYTFLRSLHGDQLFLISHDLYEEDVMDSSVELKKLLEFYLGEFSNKINDELGARLIIILFGKYFEQFEEIKALFEELSVDPRFSSRIKNLTSMKPISKQDVGDWKDRIFRNRNRPRPPKMDKLFPFGESEQKSMEEIEEILQDVLYEYNLSIRTQHG